MKTAKTPQQPSFVDAAPFSSPSAIASFDAVAHGALGQAIEARLMAPRLEQADAAPMQMKLLAKRAASSSPVYDVDIATLTVEDRASFIGHQLYDEKTNKYYIFQSEAGDGWINCVDTETKERRRYALQHATWAADVPASADFLSHYFPPSASAEPTAKSTTVTPAADFSHYFADAPDFEEMLRRPITPPALDVSRYFADAPDFEEMLRRPITPPAPALPAVMPPAPLVVPKYARDAHGSVPPLTPRRASVDKIDYELAKHIFSRLAGLHFRDSNDNFVHVPYHYPVDGCYARAQMMAEVLTTAGYKAEKVFAVSKRPGGLSAATPFGADVATGVLPKVSWGYHIAPIITVADEKGDQKYVLDPSLFDAPVTIGQWTGKMSNEAFRQMNEADIKALHDDHLRRNPNLSMDAFPPNHHSVTETHANTTDPLSLGDEKADAAAKGSVDAVRDRMTRYAVAEEAHELAKDLRAMLAGAPGNLEALAARIQRTSVQALTYFRAGDNTPPVPIQPFPNLIRDILAAYPDGLAKIRIKTALKIPFGG